MLAAQIFINIFGEYPSVNPSTVNYKDYALEDHVSELKKWLAHKLRSIPSSDAEDVAALKAAGCLGPAVKQLDVAEENSLHSVIISANKLTVQSQTAFSTVRANCCVFRGRWMYEVQLRSKGIMQIGWCSLRCCFTSDTGVGDTRSSYGLDGSKQRLWHVQSRKYGPYWRSGDILGVCIDMDAGTIEYYRNGTALGEAFRDVERGQGIALFPAFSLAFNDSVTANFGGSPFRHPVADYEPLQSYPDNVLHNADILLQPIVNLARIISQDKQQQQAVAAKRTPLDFPSASSIQMVVAGILIDELSRVIDNTYVIEEKVFNYVRSMCEIRHDSDTKEKIHPGMPKSTLGTFLTLLWMYLDVREMRRFVSEFVMFLSSKYRETPVDLVYENQRKVIVILSCICSHPMTRKYLLQSRFFKKNCLPMFLYIKPPDESTLGEMLPDDDVWTEGLGGPKTRYLDACEKLVRCTDNLYILQKDLVEKLLDNDDIDDAGPSSRKIFVTNLRKYVVENSIEHRGTYSAPTQPAVALSFLCILLDVLQQRIRKELPLNEKDYVHPRYFYDGTLVYSSHYDRLGGLVSYLNKTFRTELINMLGEAAANAAAPELADSSRPAVQSDISIYSAMFLITGGGSASSTSTTSLPNNVPTSTAVTTTTLMPEQRSVPFQMQHPILEQFVRRCKDIPPGRIDSERSVYELLDCCIMYYYAVAHKYIVMIADLRDNIGILSDILIETKASYDDVKQTIKSIRSEALINAVQDDILNELNDKFDNRKNVFAKRSIELARKQAWYRSVALGARRQQLLSWMLSSIFNTLLDASSDGNLFAFVPEVYVNILPILLDTILDFSHHDLAEQYDLTASRHIVKSAAEFLAAHSADSRIILASCKDAMLQALGTLTCHEAGVTELERCSAKSQRTLINALLRPYESRAWGQSNWLLIRFWLGEGFAFRDARPPSIWQSGLQQQPQGLLRSRGKNGSHTGLLHHIAPANPSPHFHELIARVLNEDEPFSTIFINSILSQLNWAFSEFILLLQEIQNNAQRSDAGRFESRQLKICSMCFELTVSLMRSLEMLLNIAPGIFKDTTRPNSDLLLNRVCQLICQVLARVTVPPGCFQFVVDMCLPDLSAITHFAIITGAIGILLSLLSDELVSTSGNNQATHVPRISKILLTDPSFHISNLEFALGDIRTPIRVFENACLSITSLEGVGGGVVGGAAAGPMPQQHRQQMGNFDPQSRAHIDPLTNEVRVTNGREVKPDQPIIQFNLIDYTTHVEEHEIKKVRHMIQVLQCHQSIMSDVMLPSDDSICPICYSTAVSAIFEPCKHQSCSNCIIQHLMNNKVCFYCKSFITAVNNFDGNTIYENSKPIEPPSMFDSPSSTT